MGQGREAYEIIVAGIEDECAAVNTSITTYLEACKERGRERFAAAGGCSACWGTGYLDWRSPCSGQHHTDRALLGYSEEENAYVFGLRAALKALHQELKNWHPIIEKGDLVMYDNERARASFGGHGPKRGLKVPCYSCGIVNWIQMEWRVGVKVITGEHEGEVFYTSVKNVHHVNTWKKVMEREGIQERLREYTPKPGHWVTCRKHYGKVIRLTHRHGSVNLRVLIQTPGRLRHWFPAHECRESNPVPTNMLEELHNETVGQ